MHAGLKRGHHQAGLGHLCVITVDGWGVLLHESVSDVVGWLGGGWSLGDGAVGDGVRGVWGGGGGGGVGV